MRDRDGFDDDRAPARGHRAPIAAAAAIGVLAISALTLASCGDRGLQFWQQDSAGGAANACPRPAAFTGAEFNAQETSLRALRRAAFRGDFFAQLELGSRYAALKARSGWPWPSPMTRAMRRSTGLNAGDSGAGSRCRAMMTAAPGNVTMSISG